MSNLDCVECMAASDNVVRSGLTPKLKDVSTLVNMLTYNHGPADAQILHGVPFKSSTKTLLYNPPIEEFSVLKTELSSKGQSETLEGLQGPSILIVTHGQGLISSESSVPQEAGFGAVFFIAAQTPVTLEAQSDKAIFYRAFCE